MNRIEQCFEIEREEEAQTAPHQMTRQEWAALFLEFRTEIKPLFKNGPKVLWFRQDEMRKWIDLGMVYAEDGDRTRLPMFGLTDRASRAMGLNQFVAEAYDYRLQQERIRRGLKVF